MHETLGLLAYTTIILELGLEVETVLLLNFSIFHFNPDGFYRESWSLPKGFR